MYLRSFWACKFGFCVVAHPPNAQVFLQLRRGLFCVGALVLLDTFSRSTLHIQAYGFLPCWRLQLGNNGDTDFHYAIKMRSEEHTSELQSRGHLVCRLLLEKN